MTYKKLMNNKKIAAILAGALAASVIMAGCGSTSATSGSASSEMVSISAESEGATENAGAAQADETADSASSDSSADEAVTTVSASAGGSYLDTSDLFTERDLTQTWDESAAATVTLADGASSSARSNVTIDGDTITITGEGVYVFSGSLSDGQIIVDVEDTEKVQIVLNGADITCSDSAAIYVLNADKVFVTTAEGTNNTLTVSGEYDTTDENGVDAAIFSKDDLVLNGLGTLTVISEYGHGVVSKDDLKVTGGTINIDAEKSGLNANDSVRIADGTITIVSGTDGIHAENSEDAEEGFVYIADGLITVTSADDTINASYVLQIDGGEFDLNAADDALHANGDMEINGGILAIAAGDDGMHADSELTINGGTIQITESYEGIEGTVVTVNDGEITLTARDDGFNAAGGNDSSGTSGMMGRDNFDSESDAYLTFNGGTVTVDCDGDGLDSNGYLIVNGGTILVAGPENAGNGALDYGISAEINGGTLVAVGAAGMDENFSGGTQGAMKVNFNSTTGTITLTDSEGNELVSFSTDKTYSSAVISTPEVVEGGSYTVTAGNQTVDVTMTSLIYGAGGGMGMGMGGPGQSSESGFPGQNGESGQPSGGFGGPGQGGGPGQNSSGQTNSSGAA